MRNIREILRQKWLLNRSHREVAASLNISIGGVSKIVGKADEALDDAGARGDTNSSRTARVRDKYAQPDRTDEVVDERARVDVQHGRTRCRVPSSPALTVRDLDQVKSVTVEGYAVRAVG